MAKIKDEVESFKREFRKNIITLITGAFAFVAALTWNDLIRQTITNLVPVHQELYYRLLTAVIVTLFVVAIIYILSKFKSQE